MYPELWETSSVQQPTKPASEEKLLVHISNLADLPPLVWLHHPLLLENSLSVVYGRSGVGKSFFTLDVAMKVATNHTVVYIAAEGERGYKKRFEAWCQHHHSSLHNHKLYLYRKSVQMLDDTELDTFIELIYNLHPDLVVIDTLARCTLGGDENSAKDMGRFVNACDKIRETTGAAVLVVHHTGKNENKGARGHTALPAATDMAIELTRELGDNTPPTIAVSCAKSKDAEEFDTYLLQLQKVTLPDGETSCVVVPSKNHHVKDPVNAHGKKILQAIFDDNASTGVSSSDLITSTNIKDSTFYREVKKLKDDGFVDHIQNAPYRLSDKGREYLSSQTAPSTSINSQLPQSS